MIYLIASMLLYTAAILIGTAASRNANTNIVSLINNTFSVLIPFIVAAPHLNKKAFASHKFGVIMAILGGLVVSLYVLTINKSYSENKIGIITPVVFGGAIFLSTILSIFIFKEKVSFIEGIGLFLVLSGLGLVLYARAVVT